MRPVHSESLFAVNAHENNVPTDESESDMTAIQEATTEIQESKLGSLIKCARNEQGLGLRATARQLGISPTYLSRLENGFETKPSDELIFKMSETLDLLKSDLFKLAKRIPKRALVSIAGDEALLEKVLLLVEGHLGAKQE
jgi:transcriptional regulator with XRE-family HTH domain